MDVDERVKALEEEVLILKNQIQATLLEIQELMLKQAHPSLQIPDAPKESAAAAASATTAAVAPVMLVQDDRAAMPIKLVSAQQPPTPQQPTVPPQPAQAAPAQTAPLAAHKAQTAPLDPSRVPHTAQTQSGIPNWASPEKLEKWAHEKIAKLGTARTRDLVNLYAEDGRYDESIQSYLLRLIEDHERSQQRSQQRSQPPVEPPPIKMAPYNGKTPTSSGRTPPTHMESSPALPEADADSPDAVALVESALNDAAYIQATLVEAALKQAARNEAAGGSVASKNNLPVKYAVMPPTNPMQTLSGTTGKPVPPPSRSNLETGDTSGERLILKLIAGVQNAGTKRGKHGQSH